MDRESPLPLWAQLLDDLRARIAAGEFLERFPTDKEMIEQYNVSRQTVREAVRRLELDGVVVRHRGRGTVLTNTRFEQHLGTLYSLFRELEKKGHRQWSRVLTQDVVEDPELAELHNLVETKFFHLERVRFADDLEVAIDSIKIPLVFSKPLIEVNFEHTSLYDELERLCGIIPSKGDERIAPILLNDLEAGLLGVKPPCAALLLARTTFMNDLLLESRTTKIRGDRYCFVSSFTNTQSVGPNPASAEITSFVI
ncbi:MAG: GntR family transcriptional regulator [Actinomycetota bacterium]|nr:GntR family transcriptional regulator [Actinomycetota bacterium]